MDHPIEHIRCVPMSLVRHQAADVAPFIYESAPALFDLIFGPNAIAYLTRLIPRSQNRFSHQYIRIAELNHQPVGVAVLVPAAHIKDITDYRAVLPVAQRLWLNAVQRLLLRYLLQHDYPPGSFYIGNLAVASNYRNRGIGRQLLLHCIAEVASHPLFISVDVSNVRAQKLYTSLGFQVTATKAFHFWGTSVGSQVLSLPTRDRPSLPLPPLPPSFISRSMPEHDDECDLQ